MNDVEARGTDAGGFAEVTLLRPDDDFGRVGSCFLVEGFKLAGRAETLAAAGRLVFSGVATGRGPSLTFGLNHSSYLLISYGSSPDDVKTDRSPTVDVVPAVEGRMFDGGGAGGSRVGTLGVCAVLLSVFSGELGTSVASVDSESPAVVCEAESGRSRDRCGDSALRVDESEALDSTPVSRTNGDSPSGVIEVWPDSSRTRNCDTDGFSSDAPGDLVRVRCDCAGDVSTACSSDDDRSGNKSDWRLVCSALRSALYFCAFDMPPDRPPPGEGIAAPGPLSSPSSRISSRRLEGTGEGAAVCSWKEAARAVSFRASPVEISSRVS